VLHAHLLGLLLWLEDLGLLLAFDDKLSDQATRSA
jgi:hypothetical protein